MNREASVSVGKWTKLGVGAAIICVIVIIAAIFFAGNILEKVPADKICVMVDPFDGDYHFYYSPGMKFQGFASVTYYPKRYQYWFSKESDQGESGDRSIKIRFAGASQGRISGSYFVELPKDDKYMKLIHDEFHSTKTLVHDLLKPQTERVVIASTALLTAREASGPKKKILFTAIEDQLQDGIYVTITKDSITTDELTGAQKIVSYEIPILNKTAANGIQRQKGGSVLNNYSLRVSAPAIQEPEFAPAVKAAIEAQRKLRLNVETEISKAKEAEQKAITAEMNGKALACSTKWVQEAIKATQVTKAEQVRDVAELNAQAAKFYAAAKLDSASAQAEARTLLMTADNALEIRLEYELKKTEAWANAYGRMTLPGVFIVGGDTKGGKGGNLEKTMEGAMGLFMLKEMKNMSNTGVTP